MSATVRIKNIQIGGGNRIAVQSMTNTDTLDTQATADQLKRLQLAGCDIARIAVSSEAEVNACAAYIGKFDMPLVADIQFDYRLAVKCAEIGFDKIRFNPGNIGDESKVKYTVDACKAHGTPIRIGVNTGSLEKEFSGMSKSDALVASALKHVRLLEKFGFYDIVISVKSSDVKTTVDAYRQLAAKTDYALHIGVTESGADERGVVRSAIGIGALLIDGIGDTVRVSLSGDPVKEVAAARLILQEAGLDKDYCEIISCPTCSRCKYDLKSAVDELKAATKDIKKRVKIAVMGCVVNGPGEASDADFGVAGGASGKAALFERGKVIGTIDVADIVPTLLKMINDKIADDGNN
ncbi:flavodoxin-dependent (E)-4-hydroxy-3-methylbut-2-enyl-diphosphate synthase [Anaerocaecibacter muris]|uniref:flavodoxin-dependent (E)-4-hydroxy-3-methylbut-2-enyl-diphosphate synthase n=1 Tax=Anaerocaecibacter muris TaxID=2941513 RepID=UPI0020414204|nr:flavodoxin-dependent (E)-4-hydroxy-3-methylbut-2-enyl-diphosphate synthase [Anaerocaecibacter muris]